MFLDRIKRTAFAVAAVAALTGSGGWTTIYVRADEKPVPAKGQPPVPAQPPNKPVPAPASDPAAESQSRERHRHLRKAMAQVVEIHRPIDASLRDVLEFFEDRFQLTIIIDKVAFKNSKLAATEIENTRVQIPKMPGVTLQAAFDTILDPISDPTKGVAVVAIVKRGAIHILPVETKPTVMTPDGLVFAVLLESVKLDIAKKPFVDAVQDLIDETGADIVIDDRVKDQAKKLVTAQFQNAPLVAALRVIADMVELRVITMDNVLYVTTPENAAKWKKDHALNSTREGPKLVVPAQQKPVEKQK